VNGWCLCCARPATEVRDPRRKGRSFGVCFPCGLANAQLGVPRSCRRCFSKNPTGNAPRERGPALPQDFAFRCGNSLFTPVAGDADIYLPCRLLAAHVHRRTGTLLCTPCARAQGDREAIYWHPWSQGGGAFA